MRIDPVPRPCKLALTPGSLLQLVVLLSFEMLGLFRLAIVDKLFCDGSLGCRSRGQSNTLSFMPRIQLNALKLVLALDPRNLLTITQEVVLEVRHADQDGYELKFLLALNDAEHVS